MLCGFFSSPGTGKLAREEEDGHLHINCPTSVSKQTVLCGSSLSQLTKTSHAAFFSPLFSRNLRTLFHSPLKIVTKTLSCQMEAKINAFSMY